MEFQEWHSSSNYLACLAALDERSLKELQSKLLSKGIKHLAFTEPDINNQITAIAIEPTMEAKKLCASFPLALKEFKTRNNE